GVRVVRDQLDVLLESLLGVREVAVLPVGVAEYVVGGRIVRGQLGRLLVVRDGLCEILLAEVVAAEVEVRALVFGMRGDELVELLLLPRGFAVAARLGGEDEQPLALRSLTRKVNRLLQMFEELFR